METITVTIPKQPFDEDKYAGGDKIRCYLEEALDKIGLTNSNVSAFGLTVINGKDYSPSFENPFNADIAIQQMPNHDIIVVLEPRQFKLF